MTQHTHRLSVPARYCFTEVKDIEVFKPINLWAEELLNDFNQNIKPVAGTPEADNEALEVFGNQYTLLLMFMGKCHECEQTLRKIINYYQCRFKQTGSVVYLNKMVQPTINLARFYRLNRKNKHYQTVMQCLDPAKGDITLGEIKVNMDDLSTNHKVLIKNVMIMEQVKQALLESDFTAIVSMSTNNVHLSSLISEAQAVALMATGHYQDTETMLAECIEKKQGFDRLVFYYRFYELMCLTEKEVETIDNTFRQLIFQSTRVPLAYLTLFSHYARLNPESSLVFHLIQLYENLDEELNLGLFLTEIHTNTPINVQSRLTRLGQKTHYYLLQKKIAEALRKTKVSMGEVSMRNEQILLPLNASFSLVFDVKTS